MIWFAGTRESEQPIHRYFGACCSREAPEEFRIVLAQRSDHARLRSSSIFRLDTKGLRAGAMPAAGRAHCAPPPSWMQIFFGSVKKRSASTPPSRPTPEFLTPPNGVRRSRRSQQLIQTMPEFEPRADAMRASEVARP